MSAPIQSAHIAGLFLQSVFYGMYLVTCWFSGQKLFRSRDNTRWKPLRDVNKLIVVVGLLLFLNGTLNLVFGLCRVLIAFVYYPQGPAAFFANSGHWVNVAKNSTIHIQYICGDFLLLYRCFYIYSRSKVVVIVPITLWIGSVYVFIHETIIQFQSQGITLVGNSQFLGVKYFTAFWALTIVQNLISTGLIVARLWRVEASLTAASGDQLRIFHGTSSPLIRAIIIVVESGLIITAFAFMTFVNVLCKSSGVYVTVNAGVAVVSLAFNLIIIRSLGGNATSSHRHSGRPQVSVSGIEVRMDTFTTSPTSPIGGNRRHSDVTLDTKDRPSEDLDLEADTGRKEAAL